MDIPASLKTGSTISAKSFRAVPFPPIGLIIKSTSLGRFVSVIFYICICYNKYVQAGNFINYLSFLKICDIPTLPKKYTYFLISILEIQDSTKFFDIFYKYFMT